MPDYYTDVTCKEALKCSPEDAQILIQSLIGDKQPEEVDPGMTLRAVHHDSCFAIEVYPKLGEVYFFAEDYAQVDQIPKSFVEALAGLLRKLNKDYLEFGLAYTGSKHDPGSHGGGEFRISSNGEIVWPETVWPKNSPLTITVGTQVEWTSQSQGSATTKEREVIQVVPAGKIPKAPSGYRAPDDFGMSRKEESYLVAVGKRVYWPRVAHLRIKG